MQNEKNTLKLHFPFSVCMNILNGLTSLIHKLRFIVAPSQCPHEIFMHARNMCVFSHADVHAHILLLPQTLVLSYNFGSSRTVTHTLELKCAHTVLTVQWTDKYSQSHNLYLYSSDQYMDPHSYRHSSLGFCGQHSKSSSVKLGILFPLLFSVFPLLSLPSRQLLSRRASHFPQILFSPFLFAVSVVFVSLSHIVVKQVPLWSKTPPQAEFIGLSSVCVLVCVYMSAVWSDVVREVCCENGKQEGVRGNLCTWPPFLAAWQSG